MPPPSDISFPSLWGSCLRFSTDKRGSLSHNLKMTLKPEFDIIWWLPSDRVHTSELCLATERLSSDKWENRLRAGIQTAIEFNVYWLITNEKIGDHSSLCLRLVYGTTIPPPARLDLVISLNCFFSTWVTFLLCVYLQHHSKSNWSTW